MPLNSFWFVCILLPPPLSSPYCVWYQPLLREVFLPILASSLKVGLAFRWKFPNPLELKDSEHFDVLLETTIPTLLKKLSVSFYPPQVRLNNMPVNIRSSPFSEFIAYSSSFPKAEYVSNQCGCAARDGSNPAQTEGLWRTDVGSTISWVYSLFSNKGGVMWHWLAIYRTLEDCRDGMGRSRSGFG